ncbi:actin-like protein [Trypanosoma theileri]|uniref:Actin-like protein n=1 Tax=Trypanosoma theileri TaxID=67003 RepID=A0A1X0P9A3_9TRYP|nr:actin-like protein [Trypanosoma theileri]ORC93411.1 actin-like protein [Trypanosoma theileri]
MDTTFVLDYGSHTAKYASFSKSDKTSSFDVGVNEVQSRAFVDDELDVVAFGKHLAELISENCPADAELNLSLLIDVLLPRRKRELLLKCSFEYLGAKQVFLGYTAATSLFSVGETTGISVDVGYRGVRVVPVVSGVIQTALSADVQSVGARNTDRVLRQYIPSANESLLFTLKSNACFIGDKTPTLPSHITLPDGNSLPFPLSFSACREAGEALLFHPPYTRTPDVLQYTHQKCLLEFPNMKHWVLVGGASSIRGTREILHSSMSHTIIPQKEHFHQLQVKTPMQAAISGGIILSQLSSFKGMCVNVEEYAEEGPHRCVHLKSVDGR